jgi:hypothetical protein
MTRPGRSVIIKKNAAGIDSIDPRLGCADRRTPPLRTLRILLTEQRLRPI